MSKQDYDIERGVYQTPSNDDDLYDEYDDEDGFGRGPVFAIFAVIVLSAFVGIVWLAYQQGVQRGINSQTPIVTASNDPFKVEPDDPEGMAEPVDTFTDDVLAGSTPEEQEATVTSTREEPITVPPPSSEVGNDTPTLRSSQIEEQVETAAATELAVPPPSAGVRGDEITRAVSQPTSSTTTEAEDTPPPQEVETAVVQPSTQSQPAETTVQGPPAPGTSSIPVGDVFVVQVASVPERSDADAVWTRLQGNHASILAGYAQDVRAVDLGDRGTWYRLRLGFFGSLEDATRVCNQLRAAGQDCIVTTG